MCVLATTVSELVFASFGSHFRTICPEIASSEALVAISLQNTLHHLFADDFSNPTRTKFLREKLDLNQTTGKELAAW